MASGGLREMIPAIARVAVAVGVEGLFMEVHDDPTTSPVDGPTQWPLRLVGWEPCALAPWAAVWGAGRRRSSEALWD